MNHLLRGHAPLTDAAWKAVDDEATARLTTNLAARKVVDFAGPHGWEYSATRLGGVGALASPAAPGLVHGDDHIALGHPVEELVQQHD
ncbi:encapsulin, partial [Frankia sp. AgKG'84/4]|uniref:encapsulin n=1 Tax=Frankia sp. AgKG'84/4 TaxID=573490 RepID=UPI00202A951B